MSRSAPCVALIKAFCPGEASTLRECSAVDWRSLTFEGERIAIDYEIPDPATRARAFALVRFADDAAAADIPVRGWMFTDVAAQVRGDRLHVEALVVRD